MTFINVKDSPAMKYFEHTMGQNDSLISRMSMVWGLEPALWHKEWCLAPTELLAKEMRREAEEKKEAVDNIFINLRSREISGLLAWRNDKNIYALDKTVSALLANQDSFDDSITSDMLTLPHMCTFIKVPSTSKMNGMFVFYNDLFMKDHRELCMIPITKEGHLISPIFNVFTPYKPTPLNQVIADYLYESKSASEKLKTVENKRTLAKIYKELGYWITYVFNVLLYLNATNAELRQTRKEGYVPKVTSLRDSYLQIKPVAVGEVSGLMIRNKIAEYRKQGMTYDKPASHFETFIDTDGTKKIMWVSGLGNENIQP